MTPPNKSLNRTTGSVFRIKRDPANCLVVLHGEILVTWFGMAGLAVLIAFWSWYVVVFTSAAGADVAGINLLCDRQWLEV